MNLETWARIRRKVLVEGRSKRSVMAEEGLHWETLQKMLAHAAPPGYRQSVKRGRKIDVFAYRFAVEEAHALEGFSFCGSIVAITPRDQSKAIRTAESCQPTNP